MLQRLISSLRRLDAKAGAAAAAKSLKAPSPLQLAAVDFAEACALLEFHETIVAAASSAGPSAAPPKLLHEQQLQKNLLDELRQKWSPARKDKEPLGINKSIPFANDSITLQLSEMFQHLHDIDSGDLSAGMHGLDGLGQGDSGPGAKTGQPIQPAAFTPSIGPSTHTNPNPTLLMHMKSRYADASADADIQMKRLLTSRVGFSLWLGPSQAPTPTHKAGVYLKGRIPAGTVVALYPGAAFNADMRLRALDAGNLRNPRIPRVLVPRFDGCVLDVHNQECAPIAARNPYALAHHIRAAPLEIVPNVMRLQFDFVASSSPGAAPTTTLASPARSAAAGEDGGDAADAVMPFPLHLRDYIPNVWGADVSVGQELFTMLEQNIWVKGMVVIALRPIWDEELFMQDYRQSLPHEAQPAMVAAPSDHGGSRQQKALV